MQLQGEKTVRLYPPGLESLTRQEIEDFYHFNSNDVSISVAIYHVMPDMQWRAHVHQVNYCLRLLGLGPSPLG